MSVLLSTGFRKDSTLNKINIIAQQIRISEILARVRNDLYPCYLNQGCSLAALELAHMVDSQSDIFNSTEHEISNCSLIFLMLRTYT